jgi:hypothetical protein
MLLQVSSAAQSTASVTERNIEVVKPPDDA